jgi:hypothetical protein
MDCGPLEGVLARGAVTDTDSENPKLRAIMRVSVPLAKTPSNCPQATSLVESLGQDAKQKMKKQDQDQAKVAKKDQTKVAKTKDQTVVAKKKDQTLVAKKNQTVVAKKDKTLVAKKHKAVVAKKQDETVVARKKKRWKKVSSCLFSGQVRAQVHCALTGLEVVVLMGGTLQGHKAIALPP